MLFITHEVRGWMVQGSCPEEEQGRGKGSVFHSIPGMALFSLLSQSDAELPPPGPEE